jgi:hypothetical protein
VCRRSVVSSALRRKFSEDLGTKCDKAQRYAKVFVKRESRGEGVKRWERCLEVRNNGKKRGIISEGVLKESIKKRKI